MFSLAQIDAEIALFKGVSNDLYAKAEKQSEMSAAMYRSAADQWLQAARCLERMVEETIEVEARDAMERGLM